LALAVSTYAATLIDKVGRRPLFLGATTGMMICFICWTITCAVYENSNETNRGAGYAQIPFVWLFGVCYAFAWSGLLVAYALEILPYALRAKGLMIMNITVQAILAIGGQTNPVAWKRLPKHWNLALFYTVSLEKHPNYPRQNANKHPVLDYRRTRLGLLRISRNQRTDPRGDLAYLRRRRRCCTHQYGGHREGGPRGAP
jgi:hypothetical protein